MKPIFAPKREEEREGKRVEEIRPEYQEGDTRGTTMDDEEAKRLASETADQAVEKALAKRKKKDNDDSEGGSRGEGLGVLDSKTVKSMENIANFFGAMKKVFANPLQDAVENKVGTLAANVVERAFSPPISEQKKDIIDQILNSQFAAGLGAGLGQRGPEMVNTLTQNFGKEKVDGWVGSVIAGRQGGGGFGGGIGSGGGVGPEPGMIKKSKDEERELVCSLDPNNPEHVAAYAASQSDIPIDVARKMLMIHQDAFINQMKSRESAGTYAGTYAGEQQGTQRGSAGIVGDKVGNVGRSISDNVQEYIGKGRRVSDDLIVNTPIDEDNRIDNRIDNRNPELERIDGPSIADVGQEQQQDVGHKTQGGSGNQEIVTYLKQMSDYISGLKDMVEKQNNELLMLKNDINIIKGSKDSSEVKEDKDVEIVKKGKEEGGLFCGGTDEVGEEGEKKKDGKDVLIPDDFKAGSGIGSGIESGVRSIKTIRKGYARVKDENVDTGKSHEEE